jgi:hypothetical protein
MTDREAAPALTLLMRANCALCDHLVLALELMRHRYPFDYAKVDIDSDVQLVERYGVRVPVLLHGEVEICAGHCDPAAVEAYFAAN